MNANEQPSTKLMGSVSKHTLSTVPRQNYTRCAKNNTNSKRIHKEYRTIVVVDAVAGNSKLTISAPAAVIQFFGRKANKADVHAGLVLQRHSPFVFHFDNIALVNPPDSKAISTLLDLIVSPEVQALHTPVPPPLSRCPSNQSFNQKFLPSAVEAM